MEAVKVVIVGYGATIPKKRQEIEDISATVLSEALGLDAQIMCAGLRPAGARGRWEVRLGDAALARQWGLPQGVIPVGTLGGESG